MKPAVCAAASLGAAPRPRVASWRADLADEDEVVDLEDHADALGREAERGGVDEQGLDDGARAHAADGAALDVDARVGLAAAVALAQAPGQHTGDSTSLQRGRSARARSGKSVRASTPFREMIARPKISRNEWKTAEKGAFEVGNVALLCCPGRLVTTSMGFRPAFSASV